MYVYYTTLYARAQVHPNKQKSWNRFKTQQEAPPTMTAILQPAKCARYISYHTSPHSGYIYLPSCPSLYAHFQIRIIVKNFLVKIHIEMEILFIYFYFYDFLQWIWVQSSTIFLWFDLILLMCCKIWGKLKFLLGFLVCKI